MFIIKIILFFVIYIIIYKYDKKTFKVLKKFK